LYGSVMLIYIHGFNSSSRSGKAVALRNWMESRGLGEAFVCPDLPHRPAGAIALLEQMIAQSHGPAKLVGSSLGGFYAVYLAEKHDLKAIQINPCVACHEKLASQVGMLQKNWHGGEEYEFTKDHLAELAAMHVPAIRHPENHLLLVETGDEVLDYREALNYFAGARQLVLEGGDHGFTQFNDYIETLIAF
jgi:uncharacterized protein